MEDDGRGRIFEAGPDDEGKRLDKVIRSLLSTASLSTIYSALRKGLIRVDGRKAAPDLRVANGDRIFVHATLASPDSQPRPVRTEVLGGSDAAGELDSLADILVLATRDLIFVNKPRGLLSQGDSGLEGRIRAALKERSAASLSFFPGPLHRLDRNTTGILAFPRSAVGARTFTALIRERRIVKRYLALVEGEILGSAKGWAAWRDTISRDRSTFRSAVSLEGSTAAAAAKTLAVGAGRSLLLVELETGLTHQIRVQAASRGHPLSGDAKYGGSPYAGGYILHAASLGFPDPPFDDLPSIVEAPLPDSARRRLEAIFGVEGLRTALAEAFA
jgi:23S rRNA pseudouridine955/2504/2580 synthase